VNAFAAPLGLRVDVELPDDELERELETLWRRLNRPGDILHVLPCLPISHLGLVFRYREADGEHYVYVEDPTRQRLAGYTVFNRLVELSRRADPHMRAPHSKFASAYQRRGIAKAVYSWWLDSGRCLISGVRQSSGAHALWHSLSGQYALHYVELRAKALRWFATPAGCVHADLYTRMLLLGRGQSLRHFSKATGMQLGGG